MKKNKNTIYFLSNPIINIIKNYNKKEENKNIEFNIEFLIYFQNYNKRESSLETFIEPINIQIKATKKNFNTPIHLYTNLSWININFNVNFIDTILSLCCGVIFSMITQKSRLLLGKYTMDLDKQKKQNHKNNIYNKTENPEDTLLRNFKHRGSTYQIDFDDTILDKKTISDFDETITSMCLPNLDSNLYNQNLILMTKNNFLIRCNKFDIINTVNKSLDIYMFGDMVLGKIFKNQYSFEFPGEDLENYENEINLKKFETLSKTNVHKKIFNYIKKKKRMEMINITKINNLLGQPIAILTIHKKNRYIVKNKLNKYNYENQNQQNGYEQDNINNYNDNKNKEKQKQKHLVHNKLKNKHNIKKDHRKKGYDSNNTSTKSKIHNKFKFQWNIVDNNEYLDLPTHTNGKVKFFVIRFRLLNYIYDIPSHILNTEKENEEVLRLVVPERKLPSNINKKTEWTTGDEEYITYESKQSNKYKSNYIYPINNTNDDLNEKWTFSQIPQPRNHVYIFFRTSTKINNEENQEYDFYLSSIVALKNNTDFPLYIFKSIPGNIKSNGIFREYFTKFDTKPSPPPTYTLKINKKLETFIEKNYKKNAMYTDLKNKKKSNDYFINNLLHKKSIKNSIKHDMYNKYDDKMNSNLKYNIYKCNRKIIKNILPLMKLSATEHYISGDIKFSSLAPIKFKKKKKKSKKRKRKYYTYLKKKLEKKNNKKKNIKNNEKKIIRSESFSYGEIDRGDEHFNKIKDNKNVNSKKKNFMSFNDSFFSFVRNSDEYNKESKKNKNISKKRKKLSHDNDSKLSNSFNISSCKSTISSSSFSYSSSSNEDEDDDDEDDSLYKYDYDNNAEQNLLNDYYEKQKNKTDKPYDLIELSNNSNKIIAIPLYWLLAENAFLWITIKNEKFFKMDLYDFLNKEKNADYLCRKNTLDNILNYTSPFITLTHKPFKPYTLKLKNHILKEKQIINKKESQYFLNDYNLNYMNLKNVYFTSSVISIYNEKNVLNKKDSHNFYQINIDHGLIVNNNLPKTMFLTYKIFRDSYKKRKVSEKNIYNNEKNNMSNDSEHSYETTFTSETENYSEELENSGNEKITTSDNYLSTEKSLVNNSKTTNNYEDNISNNSVTNSLNKFEIEKSDNLKKKKKKKRKDSKKNNYIIRNSKKMKVLIDDINIVQENKKLSNIENRSSKNKSFIIEEIKGEKNVFLLKNIDKKEDNSEYHLNNEDIPFIVDITKEENIIIYEIKIYPGQTIKLPFFPKNISISFDGYNSKNISINYPYKNRREKIILEKIVKPIEENSFFTLNTSKNDLNTNLDKDWNQISDSFSNNSSFNDNNIIKDVNNNPYKGNKHLENTFNITDSLKTETNIKHYEEEEENIRKKQNKCFNKCTKFNLTYDEFQKKITIWAHFNEFHEMTKKKNNMNIAKIYHATFSVSCTFFASVWIINRLSYPIKIKRLDNQNSITIEPYIRKLLPCEFATKRNKIEIPYETVKEIKNWNKYPLKKDMIKEKKIYINNNSAYLNNLKTVNKTELINNSNKIEHDINENEEIKQNNLYENEDEEEVENEKEKSNLFENEKKEQMEKTYKSLHLKKKNKQDDLYKNTNISMNISDKNLYFKKKKKKEVIYKKKKKFKCYIFNKIKIKNQFRYYTNNIKNPLESQDFRITDLSISKLTCSNKNNNLPILKYSAYISLAPMPFYRTTMLEILPFMVIINNTNINIVFQESIRNYSYFKYHILESGKFMEFHPQSKKKVLLKVCGVVENSINFLFDEYLQKKMYLENVENKLLEDEKKKENNKNKINKNVENKKEKCNVGIFGNINNNDSDIQYSNSSESLYNIKENDTKSKKDNTNSEESDEDKINNQTILLSEDVTNILNSNINYMNKEESVKNIAENEYTIDLSKSYNKHDKLQFSNEFQKKENISDKKLNKKESNIYLKYLDKYKFLCWSESLDLNRVSMIYFRHPVISYQDFKKQKKKLKKINYYLKNKNKENISLDEYNELIKNKPISYFYSCCSMEISTFRGCKFVRFQNIDVVPYYLINFTKYNFLIHQAGINEHSEILYRIPAKKRKKKNFDYIFKNYAFNFSFYNPYNDPKLIISIFSKEELNNHINIIEKKRRKKISLSSSINLTSSIYLTANEYNKNMNKFLNNDKMLKSNEESNRFCVIDLRNENNTLLLKLKHLDNFAYIIATIKTHGGKTFLFFEHYDNLINNIFNLNTYLFNNEEYNVLKRFNEYTSNFLTAYNKNDTYRKNQRKHFKNKKIKREIQKIGNIVNLFKKKSIKKLNENSSNLLTNFGQSDITEEKQKQEQDKNLQINLDIHTHFTFIGIGISISNNNSEEILYLSMKNVFIMYNCMEQFNTFNFNIGWIQIDNHTKNSSYQNVLLPIVNIINDDINKEIENYQSSIFLNITKSNKLRKSEKTNKPIKTNTSVNYSNYNFSSNENYINKNNIIVNDENENEDNYNELKNNIKKKKKKTISIWKKLYTNKFNNNNNNIKDKNNNFNKNNLNSSKYYMKGKDFNENYNQNIFKSRSIETEQNNYIKKKYPTDTTTSFINNDYDLNTSNYILSVNIVKKKRGNMKNFLEISNVNINASPLSINLDSHFIIEVFKILDEIIKTLEFDITNYDTLNFEQNIEYKDNDINGIEYKKNIGCIEQLIKYIVLKDYYLYDQISNYQYNIDWNYHKINCNDLYNFKDKLNDIDIDFIDFVNIKKKQYNINDKIEIKKNINNEENQIIDISQINNVDNIYKMYKDTNKKYDIYKLFNNYNNINNNNNNNHINYNNNNINNNNNYYNYNNNNINNNNIINDDTLYYSLKDTYEINNVNNIKKIRDINIENSISNKRDMKISNATNIFFSAKCDNTLSKEEKEEYMKSYEKIYKESFDRKKNILKKIQNINIKNNLVSFEKIFVSKLEIDEFKLIINIKNQNLNNEKTQVMESDTINALIVLIMNIPNISDARLQFNKKIKKNMCGSLYVLLFDELINDYINSGINQIFQVLGAVDFIGNPLMIFKHWKKGYIQCIEDIKNIFDSFTFTEFCINILNAISNFGKNLISGLLEGISRLCGSWNSCFQRFSRNLDNYSIITNTNLLEYEILDQPSNFVEGLYYGCKSFIIILAISCINLFYKPYSAIKNNGEAIKNEKNKLRVFLTTCKVLLIALFSCLSSLFFGTFNSIFSFFTFLFTGTLNQIQTLNMKSVVRPKKITIINDYAKFVDYEYPFSFSYHIIEKKKKRKELLKKNIISIILLCKIKENDSQCIRNFLWISNTQIGYCEKNKLMWTIPINCIIKIDITLIQFIKDQNVFNVKNVNKSRVLNHKTNYELKDKKDETYNKKKMFTIKKNMKTKKNLSYERDKEYIKKKTNYEKKEYANKNIFKQNKLISFFKPQKFRQLNDFKPSYFIRILHKSFYKTKKTNNKKKMDKFLIYNRNGSNYQMKKFFRKISLEKHFDDKFSNNEQYYKHNNLIKVNKNKENISKRKDKHIKNKKTHKYNEHIENDLKYKVHKLKNNSNMKKKKKNI